MNRRAFLRFSVASIAAMCLISSEVIAAKKTRGSYLASESKELLKKAVSYSANNDQKALNEMLETGVVFWLKSGMEFELVEATFSMVKIRIKSNGLEVWTLTEAIR